MPYVTKQYQAVLQCVQSRGADAFTAAELTEDLRHTGHPVGLATVYRQLGKAGGCRHGSQGPHRGGCAVPVLPPPSAGPRLHLAADVKPAAVLTHLECIQMEALCRHLETAHHFCMDPRRTILTGRCQHCAQEDAYGTP